LADWRLGRNVVRRRPVRSVNGAGLLDVVFRAGRHTAYMTTLPEQRHFEARVPRLT
jgi:hypothetical protein